MSSWRLSNVDEMAWFACAEEGSPLPEEKRRRRVMSNVDFTAAGRGLPSAGGAFCPNAVVGIGADDDGVVPECLGGGAPYSLARCSTLQMTVPSKVPRRGGITSWRRGTVFADAVLDVADDGAFEGPAMWWDVADGGRGAVAAVDKLARVHAQMLPMESSARWLQ